MSEKNYQDYSTKVDWKNSDSVNDFLLNKLCGIIEQTDSDITEFLLFIKALYLRNYFYDIETPNLLLLQYIYYNYLIKMDLPFYNDIISSILSTHIIRLSEKMHKKEPMPKEEKETSYYFDSGEEEEEDEV